MGTNKSEGISVITKTLAYKIYETIIQNTGITKLLDILYKLIFYILAIKYPQYELDFVKSRCSLSFK